MHCFGGIAIDADFAVEHLQELGTRDAQLRLVLHHTTGPAPEDIVIHRSKGRYQLSCGTAGSDWVFRSRFGDAFVFSSIRNRIDCHIVSADDAAWQDVLFRRVLPRIATRYGASAIHAAAIAREDRGFLLLGRSGAGKSTLTTFCATAGWRILSDDTSLSWFDDGILIEPVQRGMGVWDDVCRALALPPADCTPMPGYDGGKWWYRPAEPPSNAPRPLSAILVLERTPQIDAPQLVRLTQGEALSALLAQNIPFVPGARPGAETAAAFGRIAAISRRPAFRLLYPDGYAALPGVERMLCHMAVDRADA